MRFRIGRSNRNSTGNRHAGGGCLILFGLVFGGIGLAAFIFLGKLALDEAATYQWIETPCMIESAVIEDDVSEESPFWMEVHYRYEIGGAEYNSSQYTLQPSNYDTYEDLALQRKALLSGPVVCYVDPDNPANAVIRREGLKSGLFALFPLIFVTIGAFIVWFGITAVRKQKQMKSGAGVESISAQAAGQGAAGWKIGAVIGVVFFGVGSALIYPLAVGPISKMISSKHWVETPCKVIWSTVRRHESTDSDGHTSVTWSVDIFYEYEFKESTHRSNNYGFFGGSSSGRSGKQKIVNQYGQGSDQVCFVNPELPEQSVLKPGLSWTALIGLIPVGFAFIGALTLFFSIRAGLKRKRVDGPGRHSHQQLEPARFSEKPSPVSRSSGARESLEFDTGPRVLQPAGSRLAKTFGMLAIALFWNGIVSVFLFQVVAGFQRGKPEWFLTIFMIPFVLVGLGLLIAFFYQLLALANPRPVITLRPGSVRLGEPAEIRWELRGNASRLSSFKLSLWGVESATYRRGTNTHTSQETFFADDIVSTSRLLEMRSGTATLTIPGDLMYSFDAGNNEIKYELRIEGDVPFWPDIGDRYEIAVLPQGLSS